MLDVLNILERLEKTSSRKEKELILKENIDNETLYKFLYYSMNPYMIYNVGARTLNNDKYYNPKITTLYNKVFDLCDYLNSAKSIGDSDKVLVVTFLRHQTDLERKWFERLLTKNLRIGLSSKTINKIFVDNKIPTYDVQLAYKYEDYAHTVVDEFVLTPKLDGIRVTIINDKGNIKILTRQGQPVENCSQLCSEANQLTPNFVYDGELLATNPKNLPSKDLYRRTMSLATTDGEKKDLEFHMFDVVPLAEFTNNQCLLPYSTRRLMLEKLKENIIKKNNLKYIKIVPVLYQGKDKEVIPPMLNDMISQGREGLILNKCDAVYKCTRHNGILKIKQFYDMDLKIIGFEEGEGKYQGTLGSLIVDFKGNTVNVGTGLTDSMRNYIWGNRSRILGLIAKIGYFEISMNEKTGQQSLRFPIFKELRLDKNTVSFD